MPFINWIEDEDAQGELADIYREYRSTGEEVQKLRDAGWTDPQIAEAVYITALFAFFNRVADAFGLEDPGYLSAESGVNHLPERGATSRAS